MTERPRSSRPAVEADDVEAQEAVRPPRPVAVQLASALLIVSGLLSTLLSFDAVGRLGDQTPGIEPLALLSVALGLATALLGVLLHFGRGWLVTLNASAIAGFLELMSGIPAGWILGTVDVAVVLVLVWHRPWFAWTPRGGAGGGAPEEDEGAA